ncbi:DUF4395 domain-containing protein [Spirosoma sp.]|uniref:DUF4395 domain-containing protein n=1 Tax=Spirosoma sp. TaxID=1899569 RepID=UPI0026176D1A|nr:DUF4395 domain-containing protein [Spirosoma sp.]MCX6214128.1 DUF4395 domain-containing protein [Spirosoma sp.]
MYKSVDCPVDGVQVNENKVRVVAFLVLLIGIAYLFTGYWPLPVVLLIDFGLRAFDFGKLSPLGRLGEGIVQVSQLPFRPTDQAPKRFAAGVGFAFAILILALYFLEISPGIPTSVLVMFAGLESLAGFCAGCYVYSFLKRIHLINQ